MSGIDDFIHRQRVAYFSMEIALQNEIPTYAGGLGVLAGDTLRSAADLELPMVAVTLASTAGYFRQTIGVKGSQHELDDPWEPSKWATRLEAIVAVTVEGRRVWVGGWLYVLKGHMNGELPVVLLDTDLEQNGADDRAITRHLYGGDDAYRFKQEIVLGVGGTRMLQALGFRLRQHHMNEGHSALLGLELLHRYAYPPEDVRPGESPYDVPRVRELCCFTTHTPLPPGEASGTSGMKARLQRRAQPERLGRLADRGLHRGCDRPGGGRQRGRRYGCAVPEVGARGAAPVLSGQQGGGSPS